MLDILKYQLTVHRLTWDKMINEEDEGEVQVVVQGPQDEVPPQRRPCKMRRRRRSVFKSDFLRWLCGKTFWRSLREEETVHRISANDEVISMGSMETFVDSDLNMSVNRRSGGHCVSQLMRNVERESPIATYKARITKVCEGKHVSFELDIPVMALQEGVEKWCSETLVNEFNSTFDVQFDSKYEESSTDVIMYKHGRPGSVKCATRHEKEAVWNRGLKEGMRYTYVIMCI